MRPLRRDSGRNPIMGIGGPSPWPTPRTRPASRRPPGPSDGRARSASRSRADGPILLAEYDPAWPGLYEREAARIRSLLGDRVRLLEHAGSTSVPGLAAKPIIDIELAVPDSADEPAYVPDLEAGGYVLHGREPDWFEHRLFKGPTRPSTCTSSPRDRPRSTGRSPSATGSGPTTTIAACTRPPSASWRPATGSTSRTTPMPRTRSSRRSSGGPRPGADGPARVDIERASRYRPATHMNHHFYFRCPA